MPVERMMIKAITFDLDDTLWDVWPVVIRAEQLLHDWLAERYPGIPEQFTPLDLRELCSAVSYTHLDVYKRQVRAAASAARWWAITNEWVPTSTVFCAPPVPA